MVKFTFDNVNKRDYGFKAASAGKTAEKEGKIYSFTNITGINEKSYFEPENDNRNNKPDTPERSCGLLKDKENNFLAGFFNTLCSGNDRANIRIKTSKGESSCLNILVKINC